MCQIRYRTHRSQHLVSATAWFVSILPCSWAQEPARFYALDDLPGGTRMCKAFAVSADGRFIVGAGWHANGNEAVRWSGGEPMRLGDLTGSGDDGVAYGVSLDGHMVVGTSQSENGREAFVWTEETGMFGLGFLGPGIMDYSFASCVSPDRSAVFGQSVSQDGFEAFRWTPGEGMVSLGDLPGGYTMSFAYACSDSGRVLVGGATPGTTYHAARWVDGEGPFDLIDDPAREQFESGAFDVSADGTAAVGYACSAIGREAFRWTESAGMQALGDFPGGTFESCALGISGDGRRVVGFGNTALGREAMIWTPEGGLRRLQEVLVDDFQLQLSGWTLVEARGVSSDGRVITGRGWLNGALLSWAALIPAERMPGDVDGDGQVTISDIALLLAAYSACNGDLAFIPGADFDQSGCVSVEDLSILLANFAR